ncbi:MAG: hypothetical protein ABIJ39_06240 [Chloroflexota bacterium]
MIFFPLDGLIWFSVFLVLLMFVQRTLHRELIAILLILTRRPAVTQILFSIIFLPGVVLHESSHFLMAKLLGVKTGRFSIIPRTTADGRWQMGYVETAPGGILRDAFIGLAPLVAGCLLVAYIAKYQISLLVLKDFAQAGYWELFWMGIGLLPKMPDFWLWFYLTFAISSTMLPSASDRRAWVPMGLLVGFVVGLGLIAGAGSWLAQNIAPPFNNFLGGVAALFGISVIVHACLILPLGLFHRALSRITGLDLRE